MLACRWSRLLSADFSLYRLPIFKDVQQKLWQGLQRSQTRRAELAKADSDEDDGGRFVIHAMPLDNAADLEEPDADVASEDEEVLPLYGEDDSDYAESSSEVRPCFQACSALSAQRLSANAHASFKARLCDYALLAGIASACMI